MRWREFTAGSGAQPALGLEARLALTDLPARRPGWRVEGVDARHLRITAGGTPRLWLRGDEHGEAFLVVRAPASTDRGPSPMPPIRATELRKVQAAQGDPAWWTAWARWFAQALLSSPDGPLYPGLWRLQRCAPPRPPADPWFSSAAGPPDEENLSVSVQLPRPEVLHGRIFECGFYDGEILPLRPASHEQDGRVRMWHRCAREGTLPPLVVMTDTLVGDAFLLDGHDRLLAATVEGVVPHVLALVPVREVPRSQAHVEGAAKQLARVLCDPATPPHALGSANRAYATLHDSALHRFALTRMYPSPGGAAAWTREFGTQLESQGYDARRFFAESRFDAYAFDPRLVRRGRAPNEAR